MNQLTEILSRLSLKQKLSIVVAAVAVVAGLIGMSHWRKERDFKPLYTGLAPEDAGQVVARLKESAVEYRLSDNGGSVYVPSSKVAELRLSMAAAGMPRSGRIGFEIFDRNNFATSDFAEQVNYHRALEGEIERSVASLAEVERARVHVTFPKESLYTESRQPAKASVVVSLRSGARLSAQNVAAICQLAASAVEGLQPEAVSVLDMRGNLLNRARRPGSPEEAQSEEALEYRQRIERDILAKIANTLEPITGTDRFRASVSADIDYSSGEQTDETFDPTKSVMLTSQRTEDGASSASASGVPGTASNLPRPTSRPASAGGGARRSTENVTYASSRTVKRTRLPQGAIRRISAAVLLDHFVRYENRKRIIEPPTAAQMKTVRDLVAGAIGLVQERGDQLVLETSPFESTVAVEPAAQPQSPAAPPKPDAYSWLRDPRRVAPAVGVVIAVLAALAFGAVALRRRHKSANIGVSVQSQLPAAGVGTRPPDAVENGAKQDALPPASNKGESLIQQLRADAKKDPAQLAQIIRSWMTAD